MERNNWNERYSRDSDRSRYRGDATRTDEDSYRGAYRLDTTSDDRNKTTWDGFGQSNDRGRHQNTDFNRNYNRNYNSDYNRNYNSDQRREGGRSSGDSHYQDRHGNNQGWDEQHQPNSGGFGTRFGGNGSEQHRSVHDRISDRERFGGGNFNSDYRPDNFRNNGGENSGNMAGSLSFGYDGDNNADPDWNRYYDPMSGHRRSYHGNYESRYPEQERHRNNNDNDWL